VTINGLIPKNSVLNNGNAYSLSPILYVPCRCGIEYLGKPLQKKIPLMDKLRAD
jgi:hypothetical protein